MIAPAIQILLIEDDSGDALLVREALANGNQPAYRLDHAHTLAKGLDRIHQGGADVVLLDLSLPDSRGLDTLSRVLEAAPGMPVIVLTARSNERDGIEAVRRGAQDYLGKEYLRGPMLAHCIRYSIERQHIEDALRKANEKLRELDLLKSEFVSTVSHELRTPLAIIKEGVSQVIEGLVGSINEEQRQLLAIAVQSIDRLQAIISDLLDISKIEAGKLVLSKNRVDMTRLANEVASEFRIHTQEKDLEIKVRAPEETVMVEADENRVYQIFVNLVGNAVKFTPKGHVEISIRNAEDGVECQVADTGRGIPREHVPKLFQKFQQISRAKGPGPKGTGLGLAITKALIEAHHGSIWVESEEGKGSTFTFKIPKKAPDEKENSGR
jgi:signal transduction histidine kinase